jgi:phosphoribosylamine--glycine ligase
VTVFHAGTKLSGHCLVTNGGRVLGVTAAAASIEPALEMVYQTIREIHFEGMQYRRDIAARANRVRSVGD